MNTIVPPSDFGKKAADEFKLIKDAYKSSVSSRSIKPDGAIVEQVHADLDRLIEKHQKR